MIPYTDTQLKQALAKMLPDVLDFTRSLPPKFVWNKRDGNIHEVRGTELLHICWLVEESLTNEQEHEYHYMWGMSSRTLCHATWQQRTIALAKVKGVEIV